MNIGKFILGVLFTLLLISTINATTIGPDTYGYTATDNIEFDYVEIVSTGTNPFPDLMDDGFEGPIDIGFSFDFYGTDYTNLYLSSNGLISFNSGYSAFTNQDITLSTQPAQPVIMPYWDDLVVDTDNLFGAGVYYDTIGSPGSQQFVADWYVREFDNVGSLEPTSIRFEVILFEGSNNILFQYSDVDTTSIRPNGISATVGIRDTNGLSAGNVLQWSLNDSVIYDGQAILFSSNPIPEPATMLLFGLGLLGLAGVGRRKK